MARASIGTDGWLHTWLSRPVAVLAWAMALLIVGAWAATQVPLEWVPRVELPTVRVTAAWPGASPRAVERYVTAPIERAAARVEGTAHVESVSAEGRATVTLEVSEEVDLAFYAARVGEQLALLDETLPDRVTPYLTKEIPEVLKDEQGFMTLQLVGPASPDALRTLAEERMAPKLRSLEGVADVTVAGGTRRELLVTLRPDRLAAYGIPVTAARRRLFEATSDEAYGRLRTRGRAVLLLSPAETRIVALRRLVLSAPGTEPIVRLEDVARVAVGPAPRRSISRIDGEPVVTLTLDRAPGSSLLAVAAAVHGRLAALRPDLPEGTRLLVAEDKSEAVRGQLHDLAWQGGIGLLLVILVLLFMLKSVRATAVVLFSVAVALSVALALMEPLGLTLNLLTLGGLVLVFGLLVDNSTVMTEQLILQRARLGAQSETRHGTSLRVEATRRALQAVWLPLLGGTLTTVAVMLPLVYLSGELRALFLPFGVLVALTLGASLVSAVLLGRFLPRPEAKRRAPRWLRRSLDAPFRLATRFPKSTLAVLLLLLGTPLWLLPNQMEEPETGWAGATARLATLYNEVMETDAMTELRDVLDPALGGVVRPFIQQTQFGAGWDFEIEPAVYIRLEFPPGNPVTRADSLMQRFERVALASEAVRRTITRITERSASMRVLFTEGSLQTAEPYIMREELIQEAVLLAGLTVSVGGLLPQGYYSRSGGVVSGFTVAAYGPNYEDLQALAERFARRLKEKSRRVAAVNTNAGQYGFTEPRQVLRFEWTANAAARSGVSAGQLTAALRPRFATRFPVFYADLEGRPHLPVRVVVEGARTTDVARLVEQPLFLGDSTEIKLAALADFSVVETPSRIARADQQYRRYLRVDYRGPFRMGRELITQALEAFPAPPGYRLEQQAFSFFTEDVQKAFGWVLLATLFLVYLVTAAVFESWRLPAVVMLSVPTAAIGVALGFLWTGANFAEGAFIGVVLLVGIAVNDSILLVDRHRQLREQRPHGRASLLARLAVRERQRPMWATTLTSVVAMLPLLVFPESGDFWIGLAVTVVGGLLASTLLAPLAAVTLLVLYRGPTERAR